MTRTEYKELQTLIEKNQGALTMHLPIVGDGDNTVTFRVSNAKSVETKITADNKDAVLADFDYVKITLPLE